MIPFLSVPYVFEPYPDSIVHKLAGDGLNFVIACFAAPTRLHMFVRTYSQRQAILFVAIRLRVHLSTIPSRGRPAPEESLTVALHIRPAIVVAHLLRDTHAARINSSIAEHLSTLRARPCVFAPRFPVT
jgi:hypothetical protein